MTNRTRKTIFSAALGGLALLAAGCTTDAKVEVTNSCYETVVFAHFDEDDWAPEFRDEKFAEVEWITLEHGESSVIRRDPHSQLVTTLTVVAEGADQVWDPVEFDITLEDPENWHDGKIDLTGDNCG